MGSHVKLPIKVAAREAANCLEPQLLDTLRTLERIVQIEKEEITSGVGGSVSNILEFTASHYVHSKEAVQTLKNIARDGLHDISVDASGLVNLLNIDTSHWSLDSQERLHLRPVIEFVRNHGDELAAEAIKKAGEDFSLAHAKEAEKRLCTQIDNYDSRFGANRNKTS